jgi:lactoylglutathione lyase
MALVSTWILIILGIRPQKKAKLSSNKSVFSIFLRGIDMKEISGINHIGIRVTSLETARKFYEDLGFVFLAGPMGPEPVAIMEHPSGVNINFILNADSGIADNILMDVPERHPGYTHMALDVTDIKAIQANIEKLGIEITEGPMTLPDGGVMLFIRDQDKNVIEFHQDPPNIQN